MNAYLPTCMICGKELTLDDHVVLTWKDETKIELCTKHADYIWELIEREKQNRK